MQNVICPYCDKKIPLEVYCVFCGNSLPNYRICSNCNASIPDYVSKCPSCDSHIHFNQNDNDSQKTSPINTLLITFRPTILLIFIFSIFSIGQLAIGFVFFFFFPTEIDSNTNSISILSNLTIIIISSGLMILFLTKILSVLFEDRMKETKNSVNYLWLSVLIIATISSINIFIAVVELLLDYIDMSSLQSSPYDEFFNDPLNIILFTILISSIGPIFEELVYRKSVISAMSRLTNSKALLIFSSAFIFAISHISADLLDGSIRFTLLHFCATSILGAILGIVYIYWGLKNAIIFHSLWNISTLIFQLLSNNNLNVVVDLLVIFFTGITLVVGIYLVYKSKNQLQAKLYPIIMISKKEFILILSNFILIVGYLLSTTLVQTLFGSNIAIGFSYLIYILGIIFGLILFNKENKKLFVFDL